MTSDSKAKTNTEKFEQERTEETKEGISLISVGSCSFKLAISMRPSNFRNFLTRSLAD
jgi:hypothetical protein